MSFCLLNTFYSPIFSNINIPFLINILIIIPLVLKLGAAPFQAWFIIVIEGLTWIKCLLLITWQKLAPIFIIFYITSYKIIIPFCVLSLIRGSIGGLNQTSLKKIIAYSSINHLGWLLSSILLNKFLLIFYFIIYFILNLFTLINFIKINLTSFNQIFSKNSIHFSVSLLSLRGLPPFLGFLPKWVIINNLILININLLCFLMIITALITTFFYIRIIFRSIIITRYTEKYSISFNSKSSLINNTFLIISCRSLFLFNLFV